MKWRHRHEIEINFNSVCLTLFVIQISAVESLSNSACDDHKQGVVSGLISSKIKHMLVSKEWLSETAQFNLIGK